MVALQRDEAVAVLTHPRKQPVVRVRERFDTRKIARQTLRSKRLDQIRIDRLGATERQLIGGMKHPQTHYPAPANPSY